MVLVLLSASFERVGVFRMRDYYYFYWPKVSTQHPFQIQVNYFVGNKWMDKVTDKGEEGELFRNRVPAFQTF